MEEYDAPLSNEELTEMDEGRHSAKYEGYSSSVLSGGGRKGYEYYPQYLIENIENELQKKHSTSKALQEPIKGKAVAEKITGFYLEKGYPLERAEHIAASVAGKEHAQHIKPNVIPGWTKKPKKEKMKQILAEA